MGSYPVACMPSLVPLPDDLATVLLQDHPPDLKMARAYALKITVRLQPACNVAIGALAKAGREWELAEFWMIFHLISTEPAYRYFMTKVRIILGRSGCREKSTHGGIPLHEWDDIPHEFFAQLRPEPLAVTDLGAQFLAPSPFRQYDPVRPPKRPDDVERRLMPYLGACLKNFVIRNWLPKRRRQRLVLAASELQSADGDATPVALEQLATSDPHPDWQAVYGNRGGDDPLKILAGGDRPSLEVLARWIAEFVERLNQEGTEVSRRSARLLDHLYRCDQEPNLRDLSVAWGMDYELMRQTKVRAQRALVHFIRAKWAAEA